MNQKKSLFKLSGRAIGVLILLLGLLLAGCSRQTSTGWFQKWNTGRVVLYADGIQKETDGPVEKISNFRDDRLIMINHRAKLYAEGTFGDICKEVLKRLKGYDLLAFRNQKRPAAKIEIIPLGTGPVIAGYKTQRYRVMVNGTPEWDLYLTKDPSLVKSISKTVQLADRIHQKYKDLCQTGADWIKEQIESSDSYRKIMSETVLLRKDYLNEKRSEYVTELKPAKVSIKDFMVPSGYKRVSFFEAARGSKY